MHDWLPLIAGIGISVPLSSYMQLSVLGSGLLCGGITSLILYFGN